MPFYLSHLLILQSPDGRLMVDPTKGYASMTHACHDTRPHCYYQKCIVDPDMGRACLDVKEQLHRDLSGNRWCPRGWYSSSCFHKSFRVAYLARSDQFEYLPVCFFVTLYIPKESQLPFRIYVPNTYENLDLWANGDPTPGDPITLWTGWNAVHQTWNFTKGMFDYSIIIRHL